MNLQDKLESIARVPMLLVATDYDGTLAPIVDDPSKAHPLSEAMTALRNLAELPSTHVAVISGRALRDLRQLASFPAAVHLVGSHGSEFDADFAGVARVKGVLSINKSGCSAHFLHLRDDAQR